MEKKTVIFIGVQGSGKGTQVELLKETLNEKTSEAVFAYVSGDRLRALAQGESFTAKKVKKTLLGGDLLPPNIPTWLWSDAFAKELLPEVHFIIDGSPRTMFEAELLDAAFGFYDRGVRDVVLLSLDEDVVVERLMKRGRADDTPESIKDRLAWHHSQVMPIVDWYRELENYRVHDIDAMQAVENVHKDILGVLDLGER